MLIITISRKGWERHPLLPSQNLKLKTLLSGSKDIVDSPTRATSWLNFKREFLARVAPKKQSSVL